MLVPLKERSVQECGGGAPSALQTAEATVKFWNSAEETQDLRRALRESRTRLRRSAWESTKQIAALNNEVSRLSELCTSYRQQLARFESGVAIVELGCKLMQLSAEKDALDGVAHQVWTLERTIEAAHAEFTRLSQERDALAQELCLSKLEQRALVRS
jgi:predicted  nucleic acid-binding Zn-ribbon protein